jgi:apolipoprotein N-acyltransferase
MKLQKKHLYLLSLLSGLLLTVGWPMYGFPFLLFVGFVPLLFLIDHLDAHPEWYHRFSSFQYSYVAFFVWNALTTWWIWNSTIFGAIMAVLLNSLFFAIVFMVFDLSRRSFFRKSDAIYLLIVYWVAFEYFHLDWDLSWPWLNLGNGFAMYTPWVQWYEYTGTLGGTLWILLVNIFIYQLIKNILQNDSRRRLIVNVAKSTFVIIIPMIISWVMFQNYEEKGEIAEVIVTQPDVDPWSEQFVLPSSKMIEMNLQLADSLITPETDFVVSPESAIQEDLWHATLEQSRAVKQIRGFIDRHPQTSVVIGASTYRLFAEGEPLTPTARKFGDVEKHYEAFNSTLFLNKNEPVGLYHKSKLVPGPEKMPFQRLLNPLQNLAFDLGGTVGSLGYSKRREVFTSPDGKFTVPGIICYESIYGEFTAGFVKNGANLIFIITNDGWWGNTAGHRQHFAFARLRAIETRRDIARSANTGISGFIDQRGDIMQASEYWEPAVLQAQLHANNELTFYTRYGDYLGRISGFLAIFMVLIAFVNGVLKKKKYNRES